MQLRIKIQITIFFDSRQIIKVAIYDLCTAWTFKSVQIKLKRGKLKHSHWIVTALPKQKVFWAILKKFFLLKKISLLSKDPSNKIAYNSNSILQIICRFWIGKYFWTLLTDQAV